MSNDDVIEKLRSAVLNYNSDQTRKLTQEAIQKGSDPMQIINALTESMQKVGEEYGNGDIFLAELMMAGDAMKSAMEIVLKKIPREQIETRGTVLLGTVKGDVHDIGKSIFSSMLTAAGFEVIDIGTDVATSKFAEEATKNNPDVVAASALMTTTMPMLKELVEYFEAVGIRNKYKIIVGGGAVTKEYAEQIKADGYGADAVEGTKIVQKLVVK